MSKIDIYIDLLKEYNEKVNIYSKSAYHHLPFHIQDSLNISNLIGNVKAHVVDFGSGSGLPSAIIALSNSNNHVIAIESKQKKRDFLIHLKQKLDMSNFDIFEGDIQSYISQHVLKADVVTAKAFASQDVVMKYAKKILSKNAMLIIPISEAQTQSQYKGFSDDIQCIPHHDTRYYYYLKRFK